MATPGTHTGDSLEDRLTVVLTTSPVGYAQSK
jgi:hypothetical protein